MTGRKKKQWDEGELEGEHLSWRKSIFELCAILSIGEFKCENELKMSYMFQLNKVSLIKDSVPKDGITFSK